MVAAIPAIDADGHIHERQQEIRPYLDQRWHGRRTGLWTNNQPWDTHMRSQIETPCGYARGMTAHQQVDVWHRICDEYRIEKAVLFSTGAGNLQCTQEPDYARDVARAVNRHFATDYMTDRLFPVGVLPLRDPDAAAREIEYATTQLGLKGFELLPVGLAFALGNTFYDPIYEVAEKYGATIAIHGGRSHIEDSDAAMLETFAELHAYSFVAGILLHFTSVIGQGLPIRFPKLKLCFLEIGATWLPYYLDRLDEHWEKRGHEEMPLLGKTSPTELFRQSKIKVSIEGKESQLRETINHVGIEHLVYATDIPHWDGEFPENLEELREANNLNDAEKKAILHDNGQALFSLG